MRICDRLKCGTWPSRLQWGLQTGTGFLEGVARGNTTVHAPLHACWIRGPTNAESSTDSIHHVRSVHAQGMA